MFGCIFGMCASVPVKWQQKGTDGTTQQCSSKYVRAWYALIYG